MASVLPRVSVVRAAAQQPAPQKREAAPRMTRRSAGLSGFAAALLLSRSGAADASFREDANEKALAKAALLEATRAKAEGRAPRTVAPAAAPPPAAAAKGKAPAAPKPEAAAPKREAPMKAKAVEEVRAVRLLRWRRVIAPDAPCAAFVRQEGAAAGACRQEGGGAGQSESRCIRCRSFGQKEVSNAAVVPAHQLAAHEQLAFWLHRDGDNTCVGIVSLCVSTRAGLCPAEALENRRVGSSALCLQLGGRSLCCRRTARAEPVALRNGSKASASDVAGGVATWSVAQEQRGFVIVDAAHHARCGLFLLLKRKHRGVVAEPVDPQLTRLHGKLFGPPLEHRHHALAQRTA